MKTNFFVATLYGVIALIFYHATFVKNNLQIDMPLDYPAVFLAGVVVTYILSLSMRGVIGFVIAAAGASFFFGSVSAAFLEHGWVILLVTAGFQYLPSLLSPSSSGHSTAARTYAPSDAPSTSYNRSSGDEDYLAQEIESDKPPYYYELSDSDRIRYDQGIVNRSQLDWERSQRDSQRRQEEEDRINRERREQLEFEENKQREDEYWDAQRREDDERADDRYSRDNDD